MTQTLNLSTSSFRAGTSVPGAYSGARKASALLAQLMRLHPDGNPFSDAPVELSVPRSLLLDYRKNTFLKSDVTTGETLSYPAFGAMAEITRTGRAWSPNWSFRSGDPVGELVEYANDDELRWNEPPGIGGGPLIETSGSSNEISNPRCEGALPGTPGTLPTNWAASSITEVVGRGVEGGWPYVDVRYAATPGANVSLVTLENSFITSSPSGAGTDWTFSAGIRVVGGSTANVTGLRLRIYQFSSVPAFLSAVQGDRISPDDQHRRYHSTITTNNASTDSVKPELMLESSSGAIDITLRIYLPQLEEGSAVSSPILPEIGTPAVSTRGVETRSGGLDFQRASWATHLDWDGTNGGIVRSLVEFMPDTPCHVPGKPLQVFENSTNNIRNPRFEGGTAGALSGAGSLPTNLADAGGALAASGVEVDYGVAAGREYMDLIWDNVTPTGNMQLILEGTTQIAALTDETHTLACDAQIISGSTENIDSCLFRLIERTSGNSLVLTNSGTDFTPSLDTKVRRFFFTSTLSGGGTVAAADPRIVVGHTSGAVTLTLRLFAPQEEESASPTNPILPEPGAPAAATRAADEAHLSTTGLLGALGHMLFVDATMKVSSGGASRRVVGLDDGGTDNRINIFINNNGVITGFSSYEGAITLNTGTGADATDPGDVVQAAVAMGATDAVMSASGGTQASDVSVTLPTNMDTLRIGTWHNTGNEFSGDINSISYMPARSTDAEAEAFVGN